MLVSIFPPLAFCLTRSLKRFKFAGKYHLPRRKGENFLGWIIYSCKILLTIFNGFKVWRHHTNCEVRRISF
jgi:hypothetical protein